jgi:glutamate-1-semialdehyde 2,1-aminomutase
MTRERSAEILAHNRRFIPGGVASVNRAVAPEIVFLKGAGSHIWDADGNEYIDYHGAFAANFIGHHDPETTRAVLSALDAGTSLFGSGTTVWEGKLAQLLTENIPWVEAVQILNTGSEATAQAIRVARAATGRDHIIVMQGGYNGWHNDVACNLMTPLADLGPRRSPGEYPFIPLSAGIPAAHQQLIHPINFNDLESVEYVCRKYPVAALIAEPILQNVGVVKPGQGYLEGLRRAADQHGFVLIFDEVKTGFRSALGGYAEIAGVRPDLAVYGKAIANGYPLAVLAGKQDLLELFIHPDPKKRVLLAGTYNAHPVASAAAIATLERLTRADRKAYADLETLGQQMQAGIEAALRSNKIAGVVARQGSAFCVYFMDHLPRDWHDLAANHDFVLDQNLRSSLIDQGIYVFPAPIKQCSISLAHSAEDIAHTVECFGRALSALTQKV